MKKKTFNIMILISIIGLIAGIILILSSKETYESCKYAIENYEFSKYNQYSYDFGLRHIKSYTALYFSGITLTILSPISFVVGLIGKNVTEREKQISTEIENYLD